MVIADAGTFARRSLSVIATLDKVDKLITDEGASPEMAAALRALNVEVVLT